MKITFYRKGFANNSSSSHSLIFTREDLGAKTDEHAEFGWSYFTCANKVAKENYLVICLKESWCRWASISGCIDYNELDHFIKEQFLKWLGLTIPSLVDAHRRVEMFRHSYVDHQSTFTFPCYRDVRGINAEFATAIVREITENSYAFLGGNDNDEETHRLLGSDTTEKQAIKDLWCHLCELDSRSILCERDEKTNEFIISRKSGDIMKVQLG